MEYPPWLPAPENTHAGRILAIARCIFDMHFCIENPRGSGPMKVFDNMCSGDLEKSATVLNLVGFTEFIDGFGRRSIFYCEPKDFSVITNSERALNVDPKLVSEAVVRLASGSVCSSEEIQYLAKELE